MKDYVEQLEEQNDRLKQMLSRSQESNDNYKKVIRNLQPQWGMVERDFSFVTNIEFDDDGKKVTNISIPDNIPEERVTYGTKFYKIAEVSHLPNKPWKISYTMLLSVDEAYDTLENAKLEVERILHRYIYGE